MTGSGWNQIKRGQGILLWFGESYVDDDVGSDHSFDRVV